MEQFQEADLQDDDKSESQKSMQSNISDIKSSDLEIDDGNQSDPERLNQQATLVDIDFSMLEKFILCEDKKDFLSKLMPGTEPHYYFSLMQAISDNGLNIPPSVLETLREYQKRFEKKKDNQRMRAISLRYLFLQLE